jgi:tetratricopeptide (TPR) repeat protein
LDETVPSCDRKAHAILAVFIAHGQRAQVALTLARGTRRLAAPRQPARNGAPCASGRRSFGGVWFVLTSRFEFLKQQLDRNPDHAFSRYGLAMEYVSQGNLEEAMVHFRRLLEKHPDHTPGYYHAGQTLLRLGRKEEAVSLFRAGLEACDRKADRHTKEEILAAIEAASR